MPSNEERSKAEELLISLNELLKSGGLPRLALIDPKKLKARKLNARYMDPQTFANLLSNIKRDKRLESVPLVWERETGSYEIISGHHRVEAAVKAGLEWVLVMVADVTTEDEVKAKQLSHNALAGKDDEVLLKKIYDSIAELDAKFYSGLQDVLAGVNVVSLSFKVGSFKELVMLFLPEDIANLDAAIEIVRETSVGSGSFVRIAEMKSFPIFAQALRQVKRAEDIKSNAAALSYLIELGMQKHEERMKAREAVESGNRT